MSNLDAVTAFLDGIRRNEYLKPDLFREQEESKLFKKQIPEEKFDDMSGRMHGQIKPWDIELEYAMSEETDDEHEARMRMAGNMGMKSLETGLDSVFQEKLDECLEWWDKQSFDLKRRCLKRVIILLGHEKITSAARERYKDIADGIAWQNHHSLKEACEHLENFVCHANPASSSASSVTLQYELAKTTKELERKKELLKKKNKEIKMLRERDKVIMAQLESRANDPAT
jgi:hypothetical protein